MLNFLDKQVMEREGVYPNVVDNSTQLDITEKIVKVRSVPKSDILTKGEQIEIVDGTYLYIAAPEYGVLEGTPVEMVVITLKEGLFVQLRQGILAVKSNGKEYIIHSDGLIANMPNDHSHVEWFDKARYYGTFGTIVKTQYGLQDKTIETYMDNLVMDVELGFTTERVGSKSATSSTYATGTNFTMRVRDMSEAMGISGGFEFVNEYEQLKAQELEAKRIKEERHKEILQMREQERLEKEQRRENTKPKPRAKKEQVEAGSGQDWIKRMKGLK